MRALGLLLSACALAGVAYLMATIAVAGNSPGIQAASIVHPTGILGRHPS